MDGIDVIDQIVANGPHPAEHAASGAKILIFVPMYNCANQISRVIAQFTFPLQRRFTKLILVDNRSTDGGVEKAAAAIATLTEIDVDILRNNENYGLGGSHKVAFSKAIEQGFDYVIVLHGDDQGAIADIIPCLDRGLHTEVDCLLGARFMRGSELRGYSAFRTFGNRVFNLLFSIAARQRLYDLGSGLNLYSVGALKDKAWLTFPDDLTFNYYMILASAAKGWRMRFFPLTWREEDQRSNVKLFRQAGKVTAILLSFIARPRRFLTADWRAVPGRSYGAETVAQVRRVKQAEAGPQ
ncbi:MAG TPA: glycosyltransferase family 2 protein [Terriglobia bacterium]|nr:glycosyltransferase family 2 protein [Terriglobia bacterium]